MAVVAQTMQSSWEKQRKEKEIAFFKNAQNTLDECLASHREDFLGAVADMNAAYEKFVQDYAVVEDEIRKLLLQLSREQQKIRDLAEAKHKKMVESEKVRERGHVQGMAVAKKAMEDFNRLANSLHMSE
ncbi:hypothetical protein FOMPIDRAFT_1052520 [Fomitopsis schrenkii]|uniref:Uncharacterized protein n=1 Tax=Fomitopsis schrenkii TaxID=2126942 RepID=S8E1Q4_FOMSC|nr:hypothetical protein FOMPIDRAFT_1052520 [Fomitopsis schrenkii]